VGECTFIQHQLNQIQDPLARLIATKKDLLTPIDIAQAVDTVSSQGWRRPWLTWLGVQLKRAQGAGNNAAAAQLQRRIDLTLHAPAK